MSVFVIPPINPLRFIQPGGRLDRKSAADLLNSFQKEECYLQIWQSDDSTKIQVLSDFEFTFKIIDLRTGLEAMEIVPSLVDTTIVGQTFSVYEVSLVFAGLEDGIYIAQVDYTDEAEEDITLLSEPFEVAEKWPETLLFSYKNSENNYSVVFDTGIEFNVRVEAVIELFNPESDDLIYNDQMRNATVLDSIPYRSWTLYIGNAPGVAYWMCDLINRVMACDGVTIDGDEYTKKVGSSWEMKRAEEYPLAGMSVEIVPVENRFIQRIKTSDGTGGSDPGEFVIVQNVKEYADLAGSLSVPGEFKAKSLLEKICIIRTGAVFDLKVGTTDGGDEIGEFRISELITTITINKLFDSEVTLYLTGMGTVTYLALIWKQLDKKASGGGSGTPLNVPKGFTCIFDPDDQAHLDASFNMVSGLGIDDWEGWAICDGRNGTKDRSGKFSLGYKFEEYELGDTGGESEVALTVAELPEHSHTNSFTRTKRGGGTDQNHALGADDGDPFGDSPTTVEGGTAGAGEAHNNMPPYLVSLWVTKIAD